MKNIKVLIIAIFLISSPGCSSLAKDQLNSSSSTAIQTNLTNTTSTPTPSPTSASTLVITPTIISPTLMPDEAQEVIKTLLWNNADCSAPCFMSVIPGQTSSNDLSALFVYLGQKLQLTNTQGASKFYEAKYKFDSDMAINMVFRVQSEIVHNLNIHITPSRLQDPVTREELSNYLPNSLISQYGLPSKVTVFVDRGSTPSYAIDLYFDTRDVIVEYYSHDLDLNLELCPLSDQLDFIRIWLGEDPVNPPLDAIPLLDASSLTIQDFSILMTGDQVDPCFNLKKEVFQ